jgi:uncharacterized membrane protein YkvA (DUF1232 family)
MKYSLLLTTISKETTILQIVERVYKLTKVIKRFRFMLQARKFIPFLIAYFRSTSVSNRKKVTAVLLMIGYLLFPFDMIPDFLAFFGILDDVAVLAFIMQLIVKYAPQELKDQYDVVE